MKVKEEIIKRLSIFKNFYDEIRIIGPFECTNNNANGENSAENRSNICIPLDTLDPSNCASTQAYYSDDTVMKYDYINGEPVNITATPIIIDGKKYIVEMIKNLSHCDIFSTAVKGDSALREISELNYKVLHDDLTNVYNRRYIDEKLQKAITVACDHRKNLSIIMCDIDSFKCVNDTYGHQCGDEMLKCFASIIDKIAAQYSGWTGRYGGEEFVCLIPDKNSEDAHKIAETMRKEFQNATITYEGRKVKSTASFGIASISPLVEMSSRNLIKIADTKLYIAKESGRNLVVK